MKGSPYAILPLALFISGCGAGMDQVTHAADTTRRATEQMAGASNTASNAREAVIFADARVIEQREAAQAGADGNDHGRYELRRDQGGWTVYDTANNRPARVGPRAQAGLSRDEADASLASFQADDDQGQQQFTPGAANPAPH